MNQSFPSMHGILIKSGIRVSAAFASVSSPYGISTTCADMFLTVILKFCIIGIEVKLDAKNL